MPRRPVGLFTEAASRRARSPECSPATHEAGPGLSTCHTLRNALANMVGTSTLWGRGPFRRSLCVPFSFLLILAPRRSNNQGAKPLQRRNSLIDAARHDAGSGGGLAAQRWGSAGRAGHPGYRWRDRGGWLYLDPTGEVARAVGDGCALGPLR